MRTTIYPAIAAFFVFGFILPAKTAAQNFYVDVGENIQGFYYPSRKIRAEFKTIEHPELRNGRGEFPSFGEIKLKARGGKYLLLKPALNGNDFSFNTKTVKGIRYEFAGTFTRLNMAEDEPGDSSKEIVLTGKLKKVRSDKVAAGMDVNFTYFFGV